MIETRLSHNLLYRRDEETDYAFIYAYDTRDLYLLHPAFAKTLSQSDLLTLKWSRSLGRDELPRLSQVNIYYTSECNLQCVHCWVSGGRSARAQRPVSLSDVLSFVDKALPHGLLVVKITGGECLLRNDLSALIGELAHRGLRIQIETNGTLLSKETVEMLSRHGVFVSVSLDSHRPDFHDQMRGRSGAFHATMRGIELLRKHEVKYEIVMCIFKGNFTHFVPFCRFCSTLGPKRLKVNPVIPWGKAVALEHDSLLLSDTDISFLLMQWRHIQKDLELPILLSLPPVFFPLDSIYDHDLLQNTCAFNHILSVLSDGSISFCGVGYHEAGLTIDHIEGVREFGQLWAHSELLRKARDSLPHALKGICGSCVFARYCLGSCRGYTYHVTKDLCAPYPACQGLQEKGAFSPLYRLSEEDLC